VRLWVDVLQNSVQLVFCFVFCSAK
jgi:hypothetical protein